MTDYHKGDTIWVYATWTDKDGNGIESLANDKHTIKILDANGNDKTGTVTVSEVGSGEYYFKYTIAAAAIDGEWTVSWKINNSGDIKTETTTFTVL